MVSWKKLMINMVAQYPNLHCFLGILQGPRYLATADPIDLSMLLA